MSLSRPRRVAWLTVLVLLLAACGDSGAVAWRDLTLQVPEGWTVFEEEETRLSMGNAALGEQLEDPEDPPEDVVAMFFTHEPGVTPGQWRDFVEQRERASIESDDAFEIDGVPATRIVYRDVSNGVQTREMAVVVPARDVAVLVQPVPAPGEEDVEDRFLEHMDTFLAVLDSIEWGPPVDG